MADYNSGLPVRSEADGTDERLHVKVVDGTTPSRRMTVDADLNAHVEMHGNDPAGTDRVVRTSEAGALTPDGVYNATTNTKPGNSGMIAHTRSASPGDSTQNKRVTSVTGSGNREALDVAITDENGAPFTESNPLPVTFVDSEGNEINNYNTSASLAALGSSNHDYTVTVAKTLKLSQIWAAGSGKLKVEVQIETGAATGVFNTVFVGFNSTSMPNIKVPVNENVTVAAGVRVRVIRTNRDLQPQDVYSTISGHEI
jgi:hypothetical protein